MLREDIIKVLEIVAVFLGDNRADDVEVFSGELRLVHQLSLCSAGVHVAMRSVCQAMRQRYIHLHESFMAHHRLYFIALYRQLNRGTWTMTEEQAVAEADDNFNAMLERARASWASSRRQLREEARSMCAFKEMCLFFETARDH